LTHIAAGRVTASVTKARIDLVVTGLGDGSPDVFVGLAGGALPGTPCSFVASHDDIDLGYFFAIRQVNSVGVEGYWTSLKQGIPLTSTGKQVATPLIQVSSNETGNVGTDDFRIVIVDNQAGESTNYFAIYDIDGTVLRAFGV
jgi:hypothetical protein